MTEFEYTITDPVGIHARPAGQLAKKAGEFKSKVTVFKGDRSADTGRLMVLMSLGIKQGDTVKFRIEGSDEKIACVELRKFLISNGY